MRWVRDGQALPRTQPGHADRGHLRLAARTESRSPRRGAACRRRRHLAQALHARRAAGQAAVLRPRTQRSPSREVVVMTIRRQLVRLVAASVMPAALCTSLLIVYGYDRQRELVEARTLDVARALAQTVDRELARYPAAMLALATSPDRKS